MGWSRYLLVISGLGQYQVEQQWWDVAVMLHSDTCTAHCYDTTEGRNSVVALESLVEVGEMYWWVKCGLCLPNFIWIINSRENIKLMFSLQTLHYWSSLCSVCTYIPTTISILLTTVFHLLNLVIWKYALSSSLVFVSDESLLTEVVSCFTIAWSSRIWWARAWVSG